MNYLERADAKFVAQAADDSQRRTAIEHLSGVRRKTFWGVTVLGICFLLIFILGAFHPTLGTLGIAIGTGFFTLFHWMNLMKFESDLRLLKVVEQLRRKSV
jgi:hypothetical protein